MVEKIIHSFEVHSNESACRKSGRLGLEQVFRTKLLCQKLRIYTDHKNLTCKMFYTDIVLKWRLTLEEYGPYI